MIAPAVLLVSAGIGALFGARAWRVALAALPPAPPSGGPVDPVPTPVAVSPGGAGTALALNDAALALDARIACARQIRQ
jgi:hypothetical protein